MRRLKLKRAMGGKWFPGLVLTHWCTEPGSVVSSCGLGVLDLRDLTVGNAGPDWLQSSLSQASVSCWLLGMDSGRWLRGLTCSQSWCWTAGGLVDPLLVSPEARHFFELVLGLMPAYLCGLRAQKVLQLMPAHCWVRPDVELRLLTLRGESL